MSILPPCALKAQASISFTKKSVPDTTTVFLDFHPDDYRYALHSAEIMGLDLEEFCRLSMHHYGVQLRGESRDFLPSMAHRWHQKYL